MINLLICCMRLAGEAVYWISRLTPIKNSVAKNIRLLFPEADSQCLADKLLRNVSHSIFEIICAPLFKKEHFKHVGKINGLENIDLGLSKGNGILLLMMHTGNYELTPALLTSRGYRMNSILKAPDNFLFKIVNRCRSWGGGKLINVLKDDMYHDSLRALAGNEIVLILIDTGALEGRHETIEFLGMKVPAATGWLTLAQRSKASVVPAFSKREDGKVVLTLGEPLTVNADNREEIVLKVGQLYEKFIKDHPEQWIILLNEYETRRMVEGK